MYCYTPNKRDKISSIQISKLHLVVISPSYKVLFLKQTYLLFNKSFKTEKYGTFKKWFRAHKINRIQNWFVWIGLKTHIRTTFYDCHFKQGKVFDWSINLTVTSVQFFLC